MQCIGYCFICSSEEDSSFVNSHFKNVEQRFFLNFIFIKLLVKPGTSAIFTF